MELRIRYARGWLLPDGRRRGYRHPTHDIDIDRDGRVLRVRDAGDPGGACCPRDRELLHDPQFAAVFEGTLREGLHPGTSGAGWDNVSWIGQWDIDLGAVTGPVLP